MIVGSFWKPQLVGGEFIRPGDSYMRMNSHLQERTNALNPDRSLAVDAIKINVL
jgi:hypothetical protein